MGWRLWAGAALAGTLGLEAGVPMGWRLGLEAGIGASMGQR
jgi:hypothetical protein